MLSQKNNSKRINIIVPNGSTTNTTFAKANTQSCVGTTITWTTDSTNNRRYNTKYNIYIHWV